MNKEIGQEWVAALRSGEYKQGKGFLNINDNEFCCLGVLCELAVKEGVIPPATFIGKESCIKKYGMDGSFVDITGVLPRIVKEWAGMHSTNGAFRTNSTDLKFTSLATLNDEGWSFQKISNLIEENINKL